MFSGISKNAIKLLFQEPIRSLDYFQGYLTNPCYIGALIWRQKYNLDLEIEGKSRGFFGTETREMKICDLRNL